MNILKILCRGAASAPVYATWNPADKDAGVTLSNGNLTATSSSGAYKSARATIGKSSGKWYWEQTFDAVGNNMVQGVGNASADLTNYIGAVDANGWGWNCNALKTHSGNAAYGTGTPAVGKVIGIALDMDGGTITFFENNVSMGQAFTGISGTIYPMVSTYDTSVRMTANFGATALAYTPPSGYNAGMYI